MIQSTCRHYVLTGPTHSSKGEDGPLLPFPGRSLDIPEKPASVETGGEASMGVRFDAHMGVNANFCM